MATRTLSPTFAPEEVINESFEAIPAIATSSELYSASGWRCPPTIGTLNLRQPSTIPDNISSYISSLSTAMILTMAIGFPPMAAISFTLTSTAQ